MRLLAIIMLATLTCGHLFALDEMAELKAIAWREDSHDKVGAKGELGIYQMMPANVQKYGGYQLPNALAMMHDIIKELQAAKIDINPFNVALAWNAGTGAVIRGEATVPSYQYALSVQMKYRHLTTPSRPLGPKD